MTAVTNGTPDNTVALQNRIDELERQLAEAQAQLRARPLPELPLSQHETRLEIALEATGAGCFDVDMSTGEVWLSDQYLALIGYVPGERQFRFDDWMSMGHPDDAQHVLPQAEACLSGQAEFYQAETRLRHKDGSWIWVNGQGRVAARDENGRGTRLIGTITDVSARRAADERLRLFETLAETALDGVAYADLDGVLEYGNPAFRAMTGFGPAVVGTPIPGFFGPAEQPYVHEVILPTLHTQGQWAGTLHALRPDGTTWMAQISIFTLADADGAPRKLAGVCRDVTLQQTQEQRLRQVEVMVENAPDGFSLTDLDGRIIYFNPGFRAMLGYLTTPVGAPLLQFLAEHEHERLPQLVARHSGHEGYNRSSFERAFSLVNRQLMVAFTPFRRFAHAAVS